MELVRAGVFQFIDDVMRSGGARKFSGGGGPDGSGGGAHWSKKFEFLEIFGRFLIKLAIFG